MRPKKSRGTKLSRSALHRCLARHGVSRLPSSKEKDSGWGCFPDTPIDYVHIGSRELRLAQRKLPMFLPSDRVTKFTYLAFFDAATKPNGAVFLQGIVAPFPYRIPTVLTDNALAFRTTSLPRQHHRMVRGWPPLRA